MEDDEEEKKPETVSETKSADPEVEEKPLDSTETEVDNTSMPRSRIQRNLEKQSKRTIVLTILGIIGILALLVFYGPTLIINFSLLLGKITGSEETVKEDIAEEFIAPPILDPQPSATNSARIRVTGSATMGDQIKLYVNNELTDVTKPKKDNSFTFDDVAIEDGENTIEAISLIKDKKSGRSNKLLIEYLKKAPELEVSEPQEGEQFTGPNNISVKGKTDSGINVTVNGFVAITKDNGEFSHTIILQNSENKITVIATDRAGNKTEKVVTVHYSP